MHLGLGRTRRDMLVGRPGALAEIQAERRLMLEAERGFRRAVVEARPQGFTWEVIAEHVPGFARAYGTGAAAHLFESLSLVGSRLGERHVSWRCSDCDGPVLDRGPYGGHPADNEPGHREGCGRLREEVVAYLAELEDPNRIDDLPTGIAPAMPAQLHDLGPVEARFAASDPGPEL